MRAARRSLLPALCGAAAFWPVAGAQAQVTTIPSVSATVGGAYSTNPFLTPSGEDSASVQLDVRPSLLLVEGVNQGVVSVYYNRADYLTNYGSNSGYGATVSGTTRPDPRSSIGFTAAFDSQILGAQNGFITPTNPLPGLPNAGTPSVGTDTGTGAGTGTSVGTTPIVTTPIVTNPVVVPGVAGDVGLIGLRQRRNTLTAGVNGSYAPGPLSTWNAGVSLMRSTYPGQRRPIGGLDVFAADFRNYTGNLGYNRSLNERSSAGFQISATQTEFDRGFDTQVFTPQLTYNRSLSERWQLSLAVGAGISRERGNTNTVVSVNGSLCRSGERLQGCVSGTRTPSPTGFGGVRTTSTLGANFNYQLGAVTTASLNANYTHVGDAQSDVAPALAIDGQDLFQADLSLQRRLGRIFSAVASLSYRSASGLGLGVGNTSADIPGDFTGRLGISAFWGRR